MALQELPSVHDLIPLDLALQLIFQRVYVETMRTPGARPTRIDGLAYVVSSLVPLYAYTADRGVVRLLGAAELTGGLFVGNGKSVRFLDGRAELGNLAVTSAGMSTAVSTLANAK